MTGKTMRGLMIVLTLSIFAGPAPAATPKPMTKAQAEAKCRAELDSFDGEKRRSRTGYSMAQDMTFCVKQKTGKAK
jgi:hypothetical protein